MAGFIPTIQSLRARVALLVMLLIAGSLLIGGAAVVDMKGLDHNLGDAVRGYRELRDVYEIGSHLAAARSALNDGQPGKALRAVQVAQTKLSTTDSHANPSASAWLDENHRRVLGRAIAASEAVLLDGARAGSMPPASAETQVNAALAELAQIAADVRIAIEAHEQSAAASRRAAMIHVAGLSIVVLVAGAWLGRRLYLSVLRPLDRLGAGVQRFAAGGLEHRLSPELDREFAALSKAFNDMAREIQEFHRQLEERVETKSRQLVQSERLASVGYLAAGVAHEINNPLSIIAGYGERSLKLLDKLPEHEDDAARAAVSQAIGIICDEAFRCKSITDRLLMLARPGAQARVPVSLARVARDVVNSVGGLDRFADRRIILAAEADERVSVLGRDGELRQVVLNLLVNALEAVTPEAGEVRVDIIRADAQVQLCVRDNGRGMSAETMGRVFEPFFTEKRADRPGTGLGLSVAHAIITDCGGRIDAASDGVGRGSRFVVTLPAFVGAYLEAADAAG